MESGDVTFVLVSRCSTADQWDTTTGLGVGSSYGDGERRRRASLGGARAKGNRQGIGTGKRGRVTRGLQASPWHSGEDGGGSRRWLRLLCVHHAVVLLARKEMTGAWLWWAGPCWAMSGERQVSRISLLCLLFLFSIF